MTVKIGKLTFLLAALGVAAFAHAGDKSTGLKVNNSDPQAWASMTELVLARLDGAPEFRHLKTACINEAKADPKRMGMFKFWIADDGYVTPDRTAERDTFGECLISTIAEVGFAPSAHETVVRSKEAVGILMSYSAESYLKNGSFLTDDGRKLLEIPRKLADISGYGPPFLAAFTKNLENAKQQCISTKRATVASETSYKVSFTRDGSVKSVEPKATSSEYAQCMTEIARTFKVPAFPENMKISEEGISVDLKLTDGPGAGK